MSTPEANNTLPLENARQFALGLEAKGFRETDMQFNIGRMQGDIDGRWGFDVINPASKERLYVTEGSSLDSEDIVSGVLGEHAVLQRREVHGPVVVYDLPYGSRSLVRTMKAAPYQQSYMDKLTEQANAYFAKLAKLDVHAYNIDVKQVAITHNGTQENDGEDDMFLTLVPPLSPPSISQKDAESLPDFIARRREYHIGKKAVQSHDLGVAYTALVGDLAFALGKTQTPKPNGAASHDSER